MSNNNNNIESVNPQVAKAKKKKKKKNSTNGCLSLCSRMKACFVVCSAASDHQQPQPTAMFQLQKQLVEIETELEKQRESRTMYKTKLESIQSYLKRCLQIAQDNGFLDIITGNNKDAIKQKEVESLLPQTNSIVEYSYPYSSLAALIDQAKILGWYIEPHEIELVEVVAKGTTAEVYRGRWRGFDVAVKCIFPHLFESNEHMFDFFTQEVEVLSRQRHPFVLQLMGACLEPPNHGWIVTEFLGITLKTWLHGPGSRRKDRQIPLPPLQQRLEKGLEIAQAMEYLHEQRPAKVIHRDLKPSNIFLDRDLHVRVADFGHARFLTDDEKALTGETGTFVYMAPEIIRCGPYDEKSDVYSFGVILNELITGEHPYIETDYGPSKIAIEVASNGLRPAILRHDDEGLKELNELVQHSWDEDAAMRPSFGTITCTLRSVLEIRLRNPA